VNRSKLAARAQLLAAGAWVLGACGVAYGTVLGPRRADGGSAAPAVVEPLEPA
jgi:hypothetical protein